MLVLLVCAALASTVLGSYVTRFKINLENLPAIDSGNPTSAQAKAGIAGFGGGGGSSSSGVSYTPRLFCRSLLPSLNTHTLAPSPELAPLFVVRASSISNRDAALPSDPAVISALLATGAFTPPIDDVVVRAPHLFAEPPRPPPRPVLAQPQPTPPLEPPRQIDPETGDTQVFTGNPPANSSILTGNREWVF